MKPARIFTPLLAVTASAVLAAACGSGSGAQTSPGGTEGALTAPASTATSSPIAGPTSTAAPAPAPATTAPETTAAATAPTGGALIEADGHGWTSDGLDGPRPAPGTCHYRRAADGYPLPDPACTPGAVDPTVTGADLASTICRPGGYTSAVRPPESLTEDFKRSSEAAYADPAPTSETELDHLVPLGLGGASDTRNLWPEPDQGSPAQFDPQDPFGANAKDGVEDRLHQAVCAGQTGLVAAQVAIATDWTTALSRLGVSP